MKRSSVALAVFAALTIAGPTSAAAPIRGCPHAASGFEPMTIEAIVALGVQLGMPADLADDMLAVGETIDANDDRMLCLQDRPDTPGNPAWLFNVVDNVSNAR